MSATTSGAIKAHLEAAGSGITGVAWYRDRAPKDAVLPLGLIQEGIGEARVPMGDTGDPTADKVVEELVQVALYEVWRDAAGTMIERYDLPRLIRRRLDGVILTTLPAGGGQVFVRGRVRIPAADGPESVTDAANGANVVANIFTLAIRRSN